MLEVKRRRKSMKKKKVHRVRCELLEVKVSDSRLQWFLGLLSLSFASSLSPLSFHFLSSGFPFYLTIRNNTFTSNTAKVNQTSGRAMSGFTFTPVTYCVPLFSSSYFLLSPQMSREAEVQNFLKSKQHNTKQN